MQVTITKLKEKDFPNHLDKMNQETREWTMHSARGECGWVCSDCCCSFPEGMPDSCVHNIQRCTEIIKRDKMIAMRECNEPL